jgi:adenylosuccinate lyase
MLSLVEKGLSREQAYKLVQKHAMETWDHEADFRELVKSDAKVTAYMSSEELDTLFDYGYYLRYIDDIFQRLGLS